jgi:hypothetical protein
MLALAAIAAVVASLVGQPTTVTCQAAEQWASDPAVQADIALYGFTPAAYTRIGQDAREIALGPFGCRHLSLLLSSPRTGGERTRFAEGQALLLLIHESQHAAGWSGESDAECRAVAAFPAAVKRLGVSRAAAKGLATGAAAYHASMPDYYRAGCERPQLVAEVMEGYAQARARPATQARSARTSSGSADARNASAPAASASQAHSPLDSSVARPTTE